MDLVVDQDIDGLVLRGADGAQRSVSMPTGQASVSGQYGRYMSAYQSPGTTTFLTGSRLNRSRIVQRMIVGGDAEQDRILAELRRIEENVRPMMQASSSGCCAM